MNVHANENLSFSIEPAGELLNSDKMAESTLAVMLSGKNARWLMSGAYDYNGTSFANTY